MKPLNFDDKGCNYTSSNCVIWQGPDIPCIKLCKGDSVSDVIYKLATELCAVLDTLNIDNYDISCLNLPCAPDTFQEFLQSLISIICELQDCCNQTGTGNRTTASVNATVIPVAPCFYYVNGFGDTVTTMTVTDYATAIGNRTCSIDARLKSAETTIAIHTSQIETINNALANPAPVVLPLVTPNCVLPPFPTDMNLVLAALEQQFCELLGATGLPNDIYIAIARQCAGLGQLPVLNGGIGNMAGLPGWNVSNNNAAATINNLWLTVCDLRSAVQNIQINCCPKGCEGITLSLQGVLNGTNVVLFLTGTIPSGFTTCSPLGTLVTITDNNGGSMSAYMDIITFINNPTGFAISIASTPINAASNLHIHMEPCLSNSSTGATCQSCLDHDIINQANCPVVVYTAGTDSIAYSGTSIAGTAQYTVELWDNLIAILISSQVQTQTAPAPFTGTFIGITPNSTYKLRVVVTIAGVDTECQFETVSLIESPLLPVELVEADSFAILAGGGITNTGTSDVTGDVGSDPTNTVTGLTAPMVTGTLYTVSDPAVIAAKTALLNAYNDAINRAPVVTLGSDLIGGSTITNGYYNTPTGTIGLTGNVTFDGGGDANAVFIIKSTTTFITAAGATVTLIGGAQFCNIFWIVGSNATLGAGSDIKGNVIALTNITSNAGTIIQGRLLARNGTVTLNTNTISNV